MQSSTAQCPKDGDGVHVVEEVGVVAAGQSSSRFNRVEILDRGSANEVVLVQDLAHCQVDVGVRKSELGANGSEPKVRVDTHVFMDRLAIFKVEGPVDVARLERVDGLKEEAAGLDVSSSVCSWRRRGC